MNLQIDCCFTQHVYVLKKSYVLIMFIVLFFMIVKYFTDIIATSAYEIHR